MPEFHQHWLFHQLKQGLTRQNLDKAVKDLRAGLESDGLWGTMGWQDIRNRYRRSNIGPFWLTISMGIMVGALGLLYGTIFGQPMEDYLPYLAAGLLIWGLLSSLILEGGRAFIAAEGLIKQLPAPLSIHVYRVAWSNLVIFMHNFVIYFAVAFWFEKYPHWPVLMVIPALALLLLNGVWIGLLLGLLSARFRDIPQISASIVQVMFFITPIMWKPEMLPDRALILELNPFYYLIEIVRAPLMSSWPSIKVVFGCLVITGIGWALALIFYTAYRWRLAYWV